jgi:flagellar hook-basal body complex protein FliE
MSEISMNEVLHEMQSLTEKAKGGGVFGSVDTEVKADFSKILSEAMQQVNALQNEASSLAERFEKGDKEVNLTEVMIAAQKAEISLQAISQIRNRLVSSYQDIMNMPI